jgi:anti-sigma-K factor RskA
MSDVLDCLAVDELDAALALGAVEKDEARAVASHLASCAEPHAQLRAFVGAGEVLMMSNESVSPSPALRDRMMASVARTAQEHRPASSVQGDVPDRATRHGWLDWLPPRVARPLAVAAVAAVLAVGAWNLALQSQIGERERAMRAVAAAISGGEVAFRVDGSAGRGYLVDTPGNGAALVIANLASLRADQMYELWLVDAAGAPVAVGTFRPGSDAIQVVPLDRGLAGYATFAVTVEAKHVDAPTGHAVMSGDLTAV